MNVQFCCILLFLTFCGGYANHLEQSECVIADRIEIVISMQNSKQLDEDEVTMVKSYVTNALGNFYIGPNNTRVALIQFNPSPDVVFTLTNYTNQLDLFDGISSASINSQNDTITEESLLYVLQRFWRTAYGLLHPSQRSSVKGIKGLFSADAWDWGWDWKWLTWAWWRHQVEDNLNLWKRSTDDHVTRIMMVFTDQQIQDSNPLFKEFTSLLDIINLNVYFLCVGPDCSNSNITFTDEPISIIYNPFNETSVQLDQEFKDTFGCDPCYPDPCNGHGNCVGNSVDGTFQCNCDQFYSGPMCKGALSDSFCEANPGICRNGGTCSDGPFQSYNCECVDRCKGFHCNQCEFPDLNHSPCDSNPCPHECLESSQHVVGYTCQATDNSTVATIRRPKVQCGDDEITITIFSEFVNDFDQGFNNTHTYLSPEPYAEISTDCRVERRSPDGDYTITIPSPFQLCSTFNSTVDGASYIYTNQVWFNREVPNRLFDMPTPVLKFECVYFKDFHLTSRLEGMVGSENDQIQKTVERGTFKTSFQLCEIPAGCKQDCPEQHVVSQNATYTVGEMIHLKTKVEQPLQNFEVVITSASISCGPQGTSQLDLTKQGCRSGKIPSIIMNSKDPNRACLSFQTPRFTNCSVFFVRLELQIVMQSNLQSCADGQGYVTHERKKRTLSSQTKGSFSEVIKVGPIIVRAPTGGRKFVGSFSNYDGGRYRNHDGKTRLMAVFFAFAILATILSVILIFSLHKCNTCD